MNDPGRKSAPERDQAVPLLRELGLTGSEAEVYFAALQVGGAEPFSSYWLAQQMGRDPANVAKTITALVRRQALTVVQDKPRLYRPNDPADLADQVLARLRQKSEAAVDLLQRCLPTAPEGLVLGLTNADQALAKVHELLRGCRRHALVSGSPAALHRIGAELEATAARPGCRVEVLSVTPVGARDLDVVVVAPDLVPQWQDADFLHLVIDDRAWLCVRLDAEAEPGPCGWWGDHSPMAAILAGSLTLARQSALTAVPVAEPHEQAVGPGPLKAPPEEPAPPASAPDPLPPAPAPEPEFEEGLTYLQRHDRTDGA